MSRGRAARPSVPSWVKDAVFYQIFPDRFAASARVRKPGRVEPWDEPPTPHGFKGGDLLGIAERLDHLEELGANAIYLNPIFASASNHRYHAYDFEQVDPLLGGNRALRELLDAAHARGMRVILDGVFNHCGRGFWPFHHILEAGPQSPYIDWFTVKGWPLHAYDGAAPNYEAWWGLPALPKLNLAHPEAREYILAIAEHWTRAGIDGWRLDVPAEVRAPGFWEEFRRRVRAIDPDAYLVGEIWGEAPEWVRGDRFDAVMNYPFARAAFGLAARRAHPPERPGGYRLARLSARAALAEISRHLALYDREVVHAQLNLLDSHDTPRFLTMARGDHTALHLATLLQMTIPGAPCIYYGDEVGLEGGADPHCRRAFPWDAGRWHLPTWEWFRRAVALRRSEPCLRRGDFLPLRGDRGAIAFLRRERGEAILVAMNVGARRAALCLDIPASARPAGTPEELWPDGGPPAACRRRGSGARIDLQLEPRAAKVLRLR